MNTNFICLIVALIIILFIFVFNCSDYFKTENYSPTITRYFPNTVTQNICQTPYTNNKLDTTKNMNIYTYQYANRKILNPDQYIELVKKLLKDLSKRKINISKIDNNLLIEKDYLGDPEAITKFIDNDINNVVKKNKYLQNNGPWKYEYFFTSNPKIYYYEVNNKNKIFKNLPETFNLFKIIYTLGNPLRSSYTSCLGFITQINNELELQYTDFVNDFERPVQDNLKVIPSEALKFTFVNTIADKDFDQFANPVDYSGLNYIKEYRQGDKIDIKADIPEEFKQNKFKKQYLPPLSGTGSKYPPIYSHDGKSKIFNSPPLYKS